MPSEHSELRDLQQAIQTANASWEPAVTALATLPLREKRRRLGAEPPAGTASLPERENAAKVNLLEAETDRIRAAPAAHDWRNVGGKNFVTSIKDQGSCGSCVAFGTIAAVEGTLRVKSGDADLAVDYSEAHLFYCHAASQGRNCDSGWWVDPALEAFRTLGVVDNGCFTYTPGDQQCNLCSDWQNRVTKIPSWRSISNSNEMKDALSAKGPLITCFTVYDDFFAYHSGIYRHVSSHVVGGHCVCVVGYDDAAQCWICKNSWGPGFGEGGFFRIAYGDCGIDYQMWAMDVQAPTPTGWLENKLITGLWTINQARNACVYVDGIGWRRVATDSDIIFTTMLTLLAAAKTSKSPVNLRVEDEVIREVYVF